MRASTRQLFDRFAAESSTYSGDALRTLLRERFQTSFDGVVRTGECSRSVATSSSFLRSRAGALAILCWIAALSCTSQTATPPITSRTRRSSTASVPMLSASGPLLASASRPHHASVSALPISATARTSPQLRRIHSGARTRHSLPTPSSSATAASPKALIDSARTSSQQARISSYAHPQPRSSNWLDRLAASLGSVLRATQQQTDQRPDSHSDPLHHGRHRHRGTGRIHQVIQDPETYEPIISPQHPIVLCHGLYGFDVRGPFLGLEIHYWASTLDILRKKIGADVLIHGVPGTGSIQERAESLHRFLCSEEAGVRGKKLNFVGHSMGGLDVRYLLTHIRPKPEEYTPISLTTISTPHRGSPFMDWCNANIGIGNDYIEKAIEEARAERAHLADREPRPARTPKVPYTLKSPLFTRPKPLDGSAKQNGTSSSSHHSNKATSSGKQLYDAASAAVAHLASGSSSLENEKELSAQFKEALKPSTKKDDGGLPFGLSGFLKSLASLTGSFSSYMLSLLDTPAYAMLSTKYMNEVFNPKTPNVEGVKYYSVAARTPSLGIWHPLWLPKLILDAAAESRTTGGETDGSADALGGADQGNDGLVSVESAKWGEFLGVMEGCDHWDLRGGGAPRWKQNINPSTGKPYPSNASKKDAKEGATDKEATKSSWIDINRLLFSRSKANTNDPAEFLKTYKELAKSEGWAGVSIQDPEKAEEWLSDSSTSAKLEDVDEAEEPSVASFVPSHSDDTLVREIASWISERLPTGDADRRALAEQRDKIIQETGLMLHPTANGTSSIGTSNNPDSSGASVTSIRSSGASTMDFSASAASSQSPSQASSRTSHSASFSTTPQSEQATPTSNGSLNGTAKSDGNGDNTKRKPSSDLERFWIALCRHLHNEGH